MQMEEWGEAWGVVTSGLLASLSLCCRRGCVGSIVPPLWHLHA